MIRSRPKSCRPYEFRASGSQIKFDGFMRLYISQDDEEKKRPLPPLAKDENWSRWSLNRNNILQPPPRFSEAMLVRMRGKVLGDPVLMLPLLIPCKPGYVTREKKFSTLRIRQSGFRAA